MDEPLSPSISSFPTRRSSDDEFHALPAAIMERGCNELKDLYHLKSKVTASSIA
jgi:hypothetical protein